MTATEFSIDSSMFERKHWSLYGEVQYQTTSMVMGIYRARLHHSLGGRFRFTWKVSKDRHRDVCDLYTVRILMQFLSNQPSSPGIINPQKKKKKASNHIGKSKKRLCTFLEDSQHFNSHYHVEKSFLFTVCFLITPE